MTTTAMTMVRRRNIPWGRILLGLYTVVMFSFLLLPLIVIVGMSLNAGQFLDFPPEGLSLQWYKELFTTPMWRASIANSIKIASISTIISMSVGTAAAIAFVRAKMRGKDLVNILAIGPMVLPTIVTALAVYLVFLRTGWVGSVLAVSSIHAVRSLPYVVINMSSALKGFDPTLEKAAQSLGASRLQAMIYITLPVLRPAVITSALFAFLVSLQDLLVSLFLTREQSRTVAVVIWNLLRWELKPSIPAVSSLMLLFSVVVLLAVQVVQWRRAWGKSAA